MSERINQDSLESFTLLCAVEAMGGILSDDYADGSAETVAKTAFDIASAMAKEAEARGFLRIRRPQD